MKFRRWQKLMGLVLLGLLLTNCIGKTTESTRKSSETASPQDEPLTIWWNRSYYVQEDEALEEVIAAWQSQTGKKVNFYFMGQDEIFRDTKDALKAGNLPDIVFAIRLDDTVAPRWAWDGELADVSEVVEPLKNLYSSAALKSVYLYNKRTKKRSVYAIPFKQQTVHIHYWRDLLAQAGLSEDDIPTEWDAFWAFWKQAQDNLRAQGRKDIYALGLSMSAEASDTHATFEHVLEAYDTQLLDSEGNLLLDEPQLRQRVVAALNWYTGLYKEGYVPPAADNWINSSNNSEFLNQNVLMVVNPTLSIPGSQREDAEIYTNQIATLGFPKEPDGEPLKPIVTVKQVLLFSSSRNKETAKDFLSYLLQPENLGPYLEGSLGRYFPVMPKLASEPFWNDPADPHISTATQQFQNETRPNYQSLNPAYGTVLSENVWGRAIERVIEGVSPEAAADEALARIAEIFAQWDS